MYVYIVYIVYIYIYIYIYLYITIYVCFFHSESCFLFRGLQGAFRPRPRPLFAQRDRAWSANPEYCARFAVEAQRGPQSQEETSG